MSAKADSPAARCKSGRGAQFRLLSCSGACTPLHTSFRASQATGPLDHGIGILPCRVATRIACALLTHCLARLTRNNDGAGGCSRRLSGRPAGAGGPPRAPGARAGSGTHRGAAGRCRWDGQQCRGAVCRRRWRLPPPAAACRLPHAALVSLPPDSLSKTTAQSGDAAPLAVVCDGARSLVAAAEWEQRLGGLRLARAVLQREAQPAFAADMIATCQRLLEDSEVRVRWAVSFK